MKVIHGNTLPDMEMSSEIVEKQLGKLILEAAVPPQAILGHFWLAKTPQTNTPKGEVITTLFIWSRKENSRVILKYLWKEENQTVLPHITWIAS